MRRNDDIIRNILVIVEEHGDPVSSRLTVQNVCALMAASERVEKLPDQRYHEVQGHVKMAFDAGLVFGDERPNSRRWLLYNLRLSPSGHDYVESVRDPEIWRKTKEAASKVGGVTIGLMVDIAKTEIKRALGYSV